jgi:GR25 family glycosyltransferase involved in LPS biosynthesis
MKAYVIYLPEREHSVNHATRMLNTLKSYGLDANLYEGTTGTQALKKLEKDKRQLYPYSIKSRELSEDQVKHIVRPERWQEFKQNHSWKIFEKQPIGDDEDKMRRPGVVGCFYSHYGLWQRCVELNEPIMIFEDDVKFYRGWTPIDWDGVLILSLGKSSFLNEPYQTYLENPTGSPQPMPWRQFSMPGASGYAIKPNAARALIKAYRDWYRPADNAINQELTQLQIHNYVMGRNTLDSEGNISMTKAKDW